MKSRRGFVSNSSSSNFAIARSVLTDEQVAAIVDHIGYAREHFAREFGFIPPDDGREWEWVVTRWETGSRGEENHDWNYSPEDNDQWEITEDDVYVRGCTSMDNFDMYEFLVFLGVDMDMVIFSQ